MQEIQLIAITYFAALVGVIPPGLVNMSIAKTCVEVDIKAGKQKAIGAASVVFIQALISIIITKFIKAYPNFNENMLYIGAVVLGIMMMYFIVIAIKQKSISPKNVVSKSGRFYWKGVFISSINIFPIPYFLLLSTLFAPHDLIEFSWHIKLLFSFSAAFGSFTTFMMYVYFFDKIIKENKSFKQYSNYFMAALMFCLLLMTLYRIYG